jgi:hypothetical protein
MAESHVVSGLVAKRGELAGEAEHCRRELRRLADELGHLDATIRLFDPDYDLGGIRARRRRSAHHWFGPGECQRLVLEVLRDAAGPLSDQGVTAAVVARKGMQDRPEVLAPLQKTALAVLRRLGGQGRGAGRRAGRRGAGLGAGVKGIRLPGAPGGGCCPANSRTSPDAAGCGRTWSGCR